MQFFSRTLHTPYPPRQVLLMPPPQDMDAGTAYVGTDEQLPFLEFLDRFQDDAILTANLALPPRHESFPLQARIFTRIVWHRHIDDHAERIMPGVPQVGRILKSFGGAG